MVGQIRSYISYISVDSDQSYLDRIKKMIDDIPNVNDKATLLLEYTNKVNQINIMKRYMAERKPEVQPQVVVTPEPEEVETIEKVKTFEEEMEEKIREYQNYNDDVKEKREETTDYLPPIYTNAYNLVKVYNMKPELLKEIPVSQTAAKVKVMRNSRNTYSSVSNNYGNIPSLPIIDDAV